MRLSPAPLLLASLFVAGCATYTQSTQSVSEARSQGRVDLAAKEAAEMAQKHEAGRDAVIYELEAGSAERDLALARLPQAAAPAAAAPPENEAYRSALGYFSEADEKMDAYESKARHSLSSGLASAVVNPAATPYRGETYDKVMCSTYQALNYLALGEPEKARASLNKAYRRQSDAVAENAARIERDRDRIEAARKGSLKDDKGKSAAGFDVDRAQNDPKVSAAMADLNASLDARAKAYADYVNPFTSFVDGLFLLANSTDPQEQERAAAEFTRLVPMAEANPYLRQDALLARDLASGKPMPPTTYVIFESGEAPHREEVLVPVPLFLFTTKELLYTQVPLSRLSYEDRFNPALTVAFAEGAVTTATVCDMDGVISREFRNQLPSMWTEGLVCAATKAIIQHEFDKEIDKNSNNALAAALMKVAVLATTAATTRADTRTWRALPKTFSYARLATPADRSLTLSTPDGQSGHVTVPDARVAVVYVKQVLPGTRLLVDAFKLY